MKRIRSFFVAGMAMLGLFACKDNVENKYAGFPAYFVHKYVNTVPQLNAAMNSLGVYATIRADRGVYVFTGENGHSTQVNATAVDNYTAFNMGIAGFVVGLPHTPEPGAEISVPVCFDLACPNCYTDLHIERALQLKEGGYASCSSCSRVYNLNSQGVVSSGDSGSSLFRYRITYSGNVMAINNR